MNGPEDQFGATRLPDLGRALHKGTRYALTAESFCYVKVDYEDETLSAVGVIPEVV
jgi:hypothetical protein